MVRYKKELQLKGYKNMPTIKLLCKDGNVLHRFDNYDIDTVKKAIDAMQKKNTRLNTFIVTIAFYADNTHEFIASTKKEYTINRKFYLHNSVAQAKVLHYHRERNKHASIAKIVNNELVYVPCYGVVTYCIK